MRGKGQSAHIKTDRDFQLKAKRRKRVIQIE